MKEIHFPVNNFFTYLLGLKLVRTILQCLRICITSSFTHLLHTCQVHISIHMILFQQIFHLPLVFYSPLELVPMFVDLHLTASAHILYVVHWDIILSIILITLSKKYFNLFIMMLGESISTKRVLPQVFNEMGGLNVFITYKELWKQHVSHYRSTWTTAHILSCLFWNFFVYLGQLQPAYILILSYIWQWYLVYLHLAIGCYPD